MKRIVLPGIMTALLLVIMAVSVLAEDPSPVKYNVYVGGIQVTSANMNNVMNKLNDEGTPTVTYTPASETEWAKLTLNGAEIQGAAIDSDLNAAICSKEDLVLEVIGENTVSAIGDRHMAAAVWARYSLNIIGRNPETDILNAYGPEQGADIETLSCGIQANKECLIKDVTVNAAAKSALFSFGIDSSYGITVNNAFVKAMGEESAFNTSDGIPEYRRCEVTAASENYDGTDPVSVYKGKDFRNYKYIEISPVSEKYDVWVRGVRVTADNMDNVLGEFNDEGMPTVTYTPAVDEAKAKLTLSGAEIEGVKQEDSELKMDHLVNRSDGGTNCAILAKEDLEIVVSGRNKLTAVADDTHCKAILTDSNLVISGDGGDSDYLEITGPDHGADGVSAGVDSAKSILIRDVTVYAAGQTAGYSYGIMAGESIDIQNAVVKVQGHTCALSKAPTLKDSEIKKAGTSYDGTDSSEYSSSNINTYKFIETSLLYNIWVGGVRVSDKNKDNVLNELNDAGVPTVTYIPATKTAYAKLTLDGASISGVKLPEFTVRYGNCNSAIYTREDIEIVINGENQVTSTEADAPCLAVFSYGNVDITGHNPLTDILIAQSVVTGEGNRDSVGIMSDQGYMNIKNAAVSASAQSNMKSYGMYAWNEICFDNALVTAQGENRALFAGAGNAPSVYGCFVKKVSESYDGTDSAASYDSERLSAYRYFKTGMTYNVWVKDRQVNDENALNVLGELNNDGTPTVTYTPAAEGEPAKLTLNGAVFTGAGHYNTSDEYFGAAAIVADEDLEIIVKGENILSVGIDYWHRRNILIAGNLTITGQDLEKDSLYVGVISENVGYDAYGIYAAGDVLIRDVNVTAIGQPAQSSYGIYADGSIEVNNAVVKAMGENSAMNKAPQLSGCKMRQASAEYEGKNPASEYDAAQAAGYKFLYMVPEGYTEADETRYDVWVSGVRVTAENKDNVLNELNDELRPTVTYIPATETEWAKLTLNGAELQGRNMYTLGVSSTENNAAVYAKENLEIIITGQNTAEATDDGSGCKAVSAEGKLKITGQDIKKDCLYAFGGEKFISGVTTSAGIDAEDILISNVRVKAVGKTAVHSFGIIGNVIFDNAVVILQGKNSAMSEYPTLTGCAIAQSGTEYDGTNSSAEYDENRFYDYKYIEVKRTPVGTPAYTAITSEGKTLADARLSVGSISPAGGTIAWDMPETAQVKANTEYAWTYTPADTADMTDYCRLKGTVVLYRVSENTDGGDTADNPGDNGSGNGGGSAGGSGGNGSMNAGGGTAGGAGNSGTAGTGSVNAGNGTAGGSTVGGSGNTFVGDNSGNADLSDNGGNTSVENPVISDSQQTENSSILFWLIPSAIALIAAVAVTIVVVNKKGKGRK